MRKIVWAGMASLFAAMLGACGSHGDAHSEAAVVPAATAWPAEFVQRDVAKSWEKARIYLPHATAPSPLDKIATDRSYPVVLFMHGCWGFDTEEHVNWARLLTSQGMLVVMPDSLARPHRVPRSCDTVANYSGSAYLPVHDMRLAEIEYASREIRKQPWFDGKNLFLMGYSEGAIAVVRTPLHGFSGVIATSWTCTHRGYAPLHGIRLPRETPLLTIAVDGDPWFPAKELQGDCGARMAGRADAMHLALPGQSSFVRLLKRAGRKFFGIQIDHRENHSTSDNEQARLAVIQFLRRYRLPSK